MQFLNNNLFIPTKLAECRTNDIVLCTGCNENCIGRVSAGMYVACTINPATAQSVIEAGKDEVVCPYPIFLQVNLKYISQQTILLNHLKLIGQN